jgi:hypothetical protein
MQFQHYSTQSSHLLLDDGAKVNAVDVFHLHMQDIILYVAERIKYEGNDTGSERGGAWGRQGMKHNSFRPAVLAEVTQTPNYDAEARLHKNATARAFYIARQDTWWRDHEHDRGSPVKEPHNVRVLQGPQDIHLFQDL